MAQIAFIFAGQGGQHVGMGKDLYERFASARQVFDLSPLVRDLCFTGSKEQLDITINTQPALFLTDLACANALASALAEEGAVAQGAVRQGAVVQGAVVQGAAGFSLGEIPAACFSGLMSVAQGFDFVCARAKAMQDCAEKNSGNMFAVLKLAEEQIEQICTDLGKAYPVNYNCPGQIVVACAEECAEDLQSAVAALGGKAIKLAVSGAFHSPFMDAASQKMAEYLAGVACAPELSLETMRMLLYANVTAQTYQVSGKPTELLSKQINHPVLWQKTIENMVQDGFDTFVEVGPGKILAGLVKKINPDVRVLSVTDVPSLEKAIEELKIADQARNDDSQARNDDSRHSELDSESYKNAASRQELKHA